MGSHLLTVLYLALVTASITVTLSRAVIFKSPRDWLSRHSTFLGKLVDCPYCLSHWVGFVVVVAYRPVVRPSASVRDVVLSYVGTTFAVVTVTSILIGVLFAAFQHVPPPHSEEEEVEE